MEKLFLILKIWFIGFIIISPIIIALCKSAKLGDKGNKLINNKRS